MADTERLPHCARCASIDASVPPDAQLKLLASEDWDQDKLAFTPRAMTQEQAVAAEMLSTAIARYWRAFGIQCMGARLNSLLLILRDQAKRMRITARIREARADINSRAREAWQSGGEAAARAIEAEPTPDYPGKADDEAYLGRSV